MKAYVYLFLKPDMDPNALHDALKDIGYQGTAVNVHTSGVIQIYQVSMEAIDMTLLKLKIPSLEIAEIE